MKMKRFFTNKHKKKKSHGSGEGIVDSKPSVSSENIPSTIPCESLDGKTVTRRKHRNHKKKGKHQATNDIVAHETDLSLTYLAPNDTNVVLRRGPAGVRGSPLSSRQPHCYGNQDKRLPGSESSSRTPSSASASSSSSHRWSASRRPWSVIETFRGQDLDEFSESQSTDLSNDFSDVSNDLQSTRLVPPTRTLPRGAYVDESSNKQHKNKTLSLDFSIFRRLRHVSASSSQTTESTASLTPISPDKKGNFYAEDSAKQNKKKNKRNSWSEPFRLNPHRSSTKSIEAERPDGTQAGEQMTSPTGSLKFDMVEVSIPEEQCSLADARSSSRSQSNESSASADTITSAVEFHTKGLVESESSLSVKDENSSYEDLVRCTQCQKRRRGSRQKYCSCNRPSCNTEIRVTDTDLSSYDIPSSGTLKSKPVHSTPRNAAHTLQRGKSVSLDNLQEVEAITNKSKVLGEDKFGGSLQVLPISTVQVQKMTIPTTLPRRKCVANDMKLKLQSSPKNSMVYASSPQLWFSKRRSFITDAPPKKERPKSTSEQFPDKEISPPDEAQSQSTTDLAKTRNSLVGSPIKRAIAFPGVVLRRHQNRRMKKKDEQLNKSSSTDYLTPDRREKQVLSLNMEDLPTYEKMKDDPTWRTSSASSKRDIRISGDMGRARLRAAVLHQRYPNFCTSSDDVNAIEFMLGDDQSYENLNNMDDDEFLDLYLSGPSAYASHHYSNRSSHSQEPASKRKTLRKSVASIANLISTSKPGKQKLQRSSSFKESPGPTVKPYRPPGSSGRNSDVISSSGAVYTPGRRSAGNVRKDRSSKLWREIFDHSALDEAEVKRQEAIFELYQGERVMVQDLKMAKQTYRDSMMTLKMLTADEVKRIFGKLDCLLPLHEDLLARLEKARSENGRIDSIGHVFIEWFPTLSPYEEYCANQTDAKKTLDAVVNKEARVRDFLQRCLESPFSRKLNLWSYLDLPRSRLVKYPLLLKAILKATPLDHEDRPLLEKALEIINDIITKVDDMTGERWSKLVQSKLEYLDEKHKCKEVDDSRKIICSGQLKNNRGTKLQVFLFDLALVLTRNATRGDKLTYQVNRRPLPLKSLIVETEEGGKLSGSFKGGLLSNDKAKHSFRVRSEELNVAYTLVATDEHDKKQWINSLLEAINVFRSAVGLKRSESPLPRRGGSEKSSLDKSMEKATVSVKRSSSMKSEGSGSSPWFRHRSMTINGKPVRRNSRDKKDSGDLKRKSRFSPLAIRRSSKEETSSMSQSTDMSPLTLEEKLLIDEKNSAGRSRSLTSSPIAFLANLPRRSPRRGSGLARSESCSLKPPSGRSQVYTSQHSFRSDMYSKLSRSPSLSVTRSIPDLSSLDRHGGQRNEQFVLEEVRQRLAPTKIRSNLLKVPAQLVPTSSTSESYENLPDSPTTQERTPPSIFRHFATCSDDAAKRICERISRSPVYKTRTVTSSFPSLLPPTSTATGVVALPLSPASLLHHIESGQHRASSSSESLDDVTPLSDDVGMILDEAGGDRNEEGDFCDDDITDTNDCCSSPNTDDDVLEILNDVIDRVCGMCPVDSCSEKMVVSCQDDYIIVSSDDGSPWRGNDVEMTV